MLKSKTKIILIADNFPYGGASANLLRNFALSISNANISIKVILPHGNFYGNKTEVSNARQGMIENIPFLHLGFINHPNNYLGKFFDEIGSLVIPLVYLLFKSIQKEYDIIITYNTSSVTTLLYLLIRFISLKKLVIILPEFYEKPQRPIISVSMFKWYSFIFGLQYLVRFADGFIVLSTYMQDFLGLKTKRKDNILLMPNLTDPRPFDIDPVLPYLDSKTTIGYVGTPTKKDGILDLIKSFSLLNKIYSQTHLLIIGDITNGSSVLPDLKEYARNLDVLENITFTGLVDHNKIPALLKSCQILTLTRPNGIFAEAGFPTKLGEYFSCNRPVVITKVGDIKKYFVNEVHAIIVEPGDLESITKGFEHILKNGELAKKMATNGYNWMNENLNYKNQSTKISEFLITTIL